MKYFTLLLLAGGVSAVKVDNSGIWGEVMGGIDDSSYNSETPKDYKGVEPPKIDYEAIARKKI